MLRTLRKLRPLINLSSEYAVRNMALSVLPVRHRCRYDNILHCCVWKTASQWIRLVVSDPRIYRYSQLKPQIGGLVAEVTPKKRTIITPLYCSYDQLGDLGLEGSYKALFVVRDPRDILVSWYFSNRYSHPQFVGRDSLRAEMAPLSDEEALLWTLDNFGHIVEMLWSWAEQEDRDPNIVIVRFEDLIGPRQVEVWTELLHSLDIAVPEEVMAGILAAYSFDRLSGGRRQGEENRHDKYRKGQPGDWRNHFTEAVSERFERVAGDLVGSLGYE